MEACGDEPRPLLITPGSEVHCAHLTLLPESPHIATIVLSTCSPNKMEDIKLKKNISILFPQ